MAMTDEQSEATDALLEKLRGGIAPNATFTSGNRDLPPMIHIPVEDFSSLLRGLNLDYPKPSDPAALPIRPERHVPTSATTLRTIIARALARALPRCPCCQQLQAHRQFMTQ